MDALTHRRRIKPQSNWSSRESNRKQTTKGGPDHNFPKIEVLFFFPCLWLELSTVLLLPFPPFLFPPLLQLWHNSASLPPLLFPILNLVLPNLQIHRAAAQLPQPWALALHPWPIGRRCHWGGGLHHPWRVGWSLTKPPGRFAPKYTSTSQGQLARPYTT